MVDHTDNLNSLNEALKSFIEKGQALYVQIEKIIQPATAPEPEAPPAPEPVPKSPTPRPKAETKAKPKGKPRGKAAAKREPAPAPKTPPAPPVPAPEPEKKVTTKLRKKSKETPPPEKAKAAVIEKPVPEGKAAAGTVADIVMDAVRQTSGEFTAIEIQEKTGLRIKQVWDTLNRARKKGLVGSPTRGVYIAY